MRLLLKVLICSSRSLIFNSRGPHYIKLMVRAGKVKVTDVMFPGGSPELVEPIYKNPLLSAPFNEQLAAAVRAYAEDKLQVIRRLSKILRSLHFRPCETAM